MSGWAHPTSDRRARSPISGRAKIPPMDWLELANPEWALRDKEYEEGHRRDLKLEEALKAIVARLNALSAQVAEVRAAVGLPVEEPPVKPASEDRASHGWDS